MPASSIEVFANCYGEYGLKAAIEHAPRVGVTCLEVGLQAHSGYLVVPAEVTLTTASTPEDIRQAQEWMRQAGVTITTCNASADVSTPVGRQHYRDLIDLAELAEQRENFL